MDQEYKTSCPIQVTKQMRSWRNKNCFQTIFHKIGEKFFENKKEISTYKMLEKMES